jgi:hypothetical protein
MRKMKTTRVVATASILVAIASASMAGCERDERQLAVAQLPLEETVASDGEPQEQLVLEDPAARQAVDAYVAAVTGPISPEAEAAAIEALRAIPSDTLVSELAVAFEPSSLLQKWMILFILTKTPSPEALSFASHFLQQTVNETYDDYMAEAEIEEPDEPLYRALKLVYQALTIVTRCVRASVPEADELLLSFALDHELEAVRQAAIHEIEMLGDATLATALRDGIRPEDAIHLNPTVLPHAEAVTLDPDDPVFDDQDEPEIPQ